MATVDELLASGASTIVDANDIIYIDPATRRPQMPDSEIILGVESDKKGECKFFGLPRIVGNNIDVAQCSIQIYFENANGERDFYVVRHIAANEASVVFCWELSAKVTKYLRDTRGEYKKIVWPNFPTVLKNTGVVLAMCAVTAVVIILADISLSKNCHCWFTMAIDIKILKPTMLV